MKNLVRLEEVLLFVLSIYLFDQLSYSWWWFPALLLAPDISMVGYVFDTKIGAIVYNIFHHRGLAIIIYFSGSYFGIEILSLIGIILFAHSTLDRISGYGLKFTDSFKNTHLGKLK